MSQIERLALIAAGSNVASLWGDPKETILKVSLKLGEKIAGSLKLSPIYETPAFPAESGPDFVNACMAVDSQLPPQEILSILHEIEEEAGRVRDVRWGPRTLDLDLIAVSEEVAPSLDLWRNWAEMPFEQQAERQPDQLILPHPRMQDRAFVLRPLADVAPDWRHPVLGKSVKEMLADLPAEDVVEIRPIE